MKEEMKKQWAELSDQVWDTPEPGFCEVKSSALQVEYLKGKGFTVEENVADTKTGYCASFGHGKPVIALLGEFDALYGLGQVADVDHKESNQSEMGHGCGHHLLGTGCIAAGELIKEYLEEKGCEGTVRIYGCPGEESGSGKAYMARDGVFDDVDIALAWHPSTINQVNTGSSQSCISVFFNFYGVAAHAAGSPHEGRSALDAVELMNVGVNYMREHMESSDRVHYAITNSGGLSPNVVQAEAEVKYFIRSTTNKKCKALYERVVNIAKGASLMTECNLKIRFDEGLSNCIANYALEEVMQEAFEELGVPEYTEEELAYAKRFKDTYPKDMDASELDSYIKDKERLIKNAKEEVICNYIVENEHSQECSMGSTDVGDVSWVVPTATLNTACYSYGAGGHSWQWVAQGKSSIAHKGMIHAAEVLAKTAVKLIENPSLIEKAKEEFDMRLDGESYECLIPKDVKPHESV